MKSTKKRAKLGDIESADSLICAHGSFMWMVIHANERGSGRRSSCAADKRTMGVRWHKLRRETGRQNKARIGEQSKGRTCHRC
jgi:hypothetical protein